MGRYATLKKEFEFLVKTYGFEICLKQKRGAYYFIEWTNQNISIMAEEVFICAMNGKIITNDYNLISQVVNKNK